MTPQEKNLLKFYLLTLKKVHKLIERNPVLQGSELENSLFECVNGDFVYQCLNIPLDRHGKECYERYGGQDCDCNECFCQDMFHNCEGDYWLDGGSISKSIKDFEKALDWTNKQIKDGKLKPVYDKKNYI